MPTNVDTLRQSRVLATDPPAHLKPQEEQLINALTAGEIAALIAIRGKVGDYSFEAASGRIRPWIL